MTDREFVNKITRYFLGNDWYSYYFNNEDINNDAYYHITHKYSNKLKDKTILNYRLKHKKCKWCKYYKNIIPVCLPHVCGEGYECSLKEKIIKHNKATFCKYYTLKELEGAKECR